MVQFLVQSTYELTIHLYLLSTYNTSSWAKLHVNWFSISWGKNYIICYGMTHQIPLFPGSFTMNF